MVLPCSHLGLLSAGSGDNKNNQAGYQPLPGESTSVGLL